MYDVHYMAVIYLPAILVAFMGLALMLVDLKLALWVSVGVLVIVLGVGFMVGDIPSSSADDLKLPFRMMSFVLVLTAAVLFLLSSLAIVIKSIVRGPREEEAAPDALAGADRP